MRSCNKNLVLGIAISLATPSIALAEGFYATAQLGVSQHANDSEAYGNNIAVDSDFPSSFDTESGHVSGVGIGYLFNDQFRIEGRLGYRDSNFNDRQMGTGAREGEEYYLNGNIKSVTVTLEGFYDFVNDSSFTPYIKAGVGVSNNDYSARLGGTGIAAFDPFDGKADGYYDDYADGDSTEFSWNLGFGGTLEVSKNTSIYGEYQYASFGDVKTGQDAFTDGFKVNDAASHEVVIGVRIAI